MIIYVESIAERFIKENPSVKEQFDQWLIFDQLRGKHEIGCVIEVTHINDGPIENCGVGVVSIETNHIGDNKLLGYARTDKHGRAYLELPKFTEALVRVRHVDYVSYETPIFNTENNCSFKMKIVL